MTDVKLTVIKNTKRQSDRYQVTGDKVTDVKLTNEKVDNTPMLRIVITCGTGSAFRELLRFTNVSLQILKSWSFELSYLHKSNRLHIKTVDSDQKKLMNFNHNSCHQPHSNL